MNAIAFDPMDGSWTDPFGGIRDIDGRLIRAVGDAKLRFQEDGLRILRAARFVATLEFDLDATTMQAITESASRIDCVSAERVRDELYKILGSSRPSKAFDVMQATGVLGRVLPEALPSIGCMQNRYHEYDVWEHTLAAVDACRPDLVLRLALLLHDLGKPAVRSTNAKTGDVAFYHHEDESAALAERVAARLRMSGDMRRRVVHLVRHHVIQYDASWSASALRRWVQRVGGEYVGDLLEMGRADAVGKGEKAGDALGLLLDMQRQLDEHCAADAALGLRDLAVSGRDLMRELGLEQGPVVGKVLAHLLSLVVDDPALNCPVMLLDAARRYIATDDTERLRVSSCSNGFATWFDLVACQRCTKRRTALAGRLSERSFVGQSLGLHARQ